MHKTLLSFAMETIYLFHRFNNRCDKKYTEEDFIRSVLDNNTGFDPEEEKVCIFADNVETLSERLFANELQNEGESTNFEWKVLVHRS